MVSPSKRSRWTTDRKKERRGDASGVPISRLIGLRIDLFVLQGAKSSPVFRYVYGSFAARFTQLDTQWSMLLTGCYVTSICIFYHVRFLPDDMNLLHTSVVSVSIMLTLRLCT